MVSHWGIKSVMSVRSATSTMRSMNASQWDARSGFLQSRASWLQQACLYGRTERVRALAAQKWGPADCPLLPWTCSLFSQSLPCAQEIQNSTFSVLSLPLPTPKQIQGTHLGPQQFKEKTYYIAIASKKQTQTFPWFARYQNISLEKKWIKDYTFKSRCLTALVFWKIPGLTPAWKIIVR